MEPYRGILKTPSICSPESILANVFVKANPTSLAPSFLASSRSLGAAFFLFFFFSVRLVHTESIERKADEIYFSWSTVVWVCRPEARWRGLRTLWAHTSPVLERS